MEHQDALASRSSVQSSARKYHSGFGVSALPDWNGSSGELIGAFRTARDERIYTQRSRPSFPRRMTWLYPRDGCYVRAAHTAQSLARHGRHRPGKIFAFGRLSLKTPYDRRGRVYWWYHAAAAYEVGGVARVLDPAISHTRILDLGEWLSRISSRVTNVRVSICDTWAYSPGSRCFGGSQGPDRAARRQADRYLTREWNNLRSLGLNPTRLLGDFPPWREAAAEDEITEETGSEPASCLP